MTKNWMTDMTQEMEATMPEGAVEFPGTRHTAEIKTRIQVFSVVFVFDFGHDTNRWLGTNDETDTQHREH